MKKADTALSGFTAYFHSFGGLLLLAEIKTNTYGVGRIKNYCTMENQGRSNWSSRRTKRITITIPASLFQVLEEASTRQGRSMSNLSAFLLEMAAIEQKS